MVICLLYSSACYLRPFTSVLQIFFKTSPVSIFLNNSGEAMTPSLLNSEHANDVGFQLHDPSIFTLSVESIDHLRVVVSLPQNFSMVLVIYKLERHPDVAGATSSSRGSKSFH